MKIGILTGGGDAPGLNGVIEAVTRALLMRGHQVLGICDGFEGVKVHRDEARANDPKRQPRGCRVPF